jgi:spore coat protein U-like protein
VLCIWLLAAPGVALGQTDCTCTPSSTTVNFGAYDVLSGTPLDGAGSFSLTCRMDRPRSSNIRVLYSAKLATAPTRRLAPPAGGDRLGYDVYVDAARTQPWGDGTGGTFAMTGSVTIPAGGSVTDGPRNYYGRIAPGGQDVSAAAPGPPPTTYRQTLSITVTCRRD